MTCRSETVDGLSYRYCPDELPPPADRIRAIMMGRFTDELTGSPISAALWVSSDMSNMWVRASADAVGGLVGNPARRFPGLAGASVPLEMTVSCRRYLPQTFNADLGPFNTGLGHPADFPEHFEPVDLGNVGLRRQATIVGGRCALNNGIDRTPLGNATIQIIGIWHQFPAANVDPLAVVQPPDIVSLRQGLYRRRQPGTDQLRRRTLLPQLGDEKRIMLPAMSGSNQVRLSDRINLSAGQVLGLEIDHRELVEYIEVDSIDGASTASQPATVTLAYPLRCDHRQGVETVRVNPQPAGSANGFIRDAIVGDQTLFLDGLTDIDNTAIEITGSGDPEYHAVSLYDMMSDADGYYSMPPIARVAMMQISASHPLPASSVDLTFSPDYEQFGNRVDLIFS
ncbi:MAG: hypothetical protein GY916_06985 [Gammaproteobacteria bacterium]|nr:hypothetical protein [Gammaproteobacteria bacterium]